jgi:CHASE3 domain sensor protein
MTVKHPAKEWRGSMKIRQKILIGYFIVLAVFAITVLIGITNIHRMQASYAGLIDQRFSLVSETKDFLTGFEYEALMMRTYFITGQDEWAQEKKNSYRKTK